MAPMSTRPPFIAAVASHDPASVHVIGFRVTERLSRPSSLRLRVAFDDLAPEDGAGLLGAAAQLVVEGDSGARRRFGGVVRRVVFEGDAAERRAMYTLEVVTRDHLIRQRRTTRIFQDKTVPEIVLEVLSKAGVSASSNLARSYAARAYCVQYQEDDLHFVRRLLAEEGIYYFIEDANGEADEPERVVLADTLDALERLPAALPFRPRSGFTASGEFAESIRSRTVVEPALEVVRSFDFRKPQVILSSEPSHRTQIEIH